MKACAACKQLLPKSAFQKNNSKACGVQSACKACCAATASGGGVLSDRRARYAAKTPEWRKDTAAKERAARIAADPEGEKNYTKQWRGRNPGRARQISLKAYGLVLADEQQMLAAQGGGCAICGVTSPRDGGNKRAKVFCVDHDHVDGFTLLPPEEKRRHVRGLLCNNCNVLLGNAGDSTERLSAAVTYLNKHHQNPNK